MQAKDGISTVKPLDTMVLANQSVALIYSPVSFGCNMLDTMVLANQSVA
jgi:hypothetical protein